MSSWQIIGLIWLVGVLILIGPQGWRLLRGNPNVPYYLAGWLAFAVVAALVFQFVW